MVLVGPAILGGPFFTVSCRFPGRQVSQCLQEIIRLCGAFSALLFGCKELQMTERDRGEVEAIGKARGGRQAAEPVPHLHLPITHIH